MCLRTIFSVIFLAPYYLTDRLRMLHPDKAELEKLKSGLRALFAHIERISQEIASIRQPDAAESDDKFSQISGELDAIVSATEDATEAIMENAEQIEAEVNAALKVSGDPAVKTALAKINDHTAAIFEACAFQDITGQRVSKIVKTLVYVEERVNALIEAWGHEMLSHSHPVEPEHPTGDKALLSGPQLAGHGVSQGDVDVLLQVPHALPDNEMDSRFG